MSEQLYKALLITCLSLFTIIFCAVVVPGLIENPDIIAAFAAGFVNPFAAGYSSDVIICALIVWIWIIYEKMNYQVKYGGLCMILCIVPGVAVGFALYLILRHKQIKTLKLED